MEIAATACVVVVGATLILSSAKASVERVNMPTDVIVASTGAAVRPGINPVPTRGPAPEPNGPTSTARPKPGANSRLAVTLEESTASGQRSGPVVIRVVCADGTTGTFTIPVDATLPTTSSFLRFDHETSCTVGQMRTGGATLVRWRVNTPEGERAGVGTSTEVGIWHGNYPGHTYVVKFVNSFPSTSPSPTPDPTQSVQPTPSPTQTQQPDVDPVGGRHPQFPIDPPVIPGKLDPTGPNVILPGTVETNAGNNVRATVFCTAYKGQLNRARFTGDVPPACAVRTRQSGEVTLELKVTEPTRVWAVFYAPGNDTHRAYLRVKSWIVLP